MTLPPFPFFYFRKGTDSSNMSLSTFHEKSHPKSFSWDQHADHITREHRQNSQQPPRGSGPGSRISHSHISQEMHKEADFNGPLGSVKAWGTSSLRGQDISYQPC